MATPNFPIMMHEVYVIHTKDEKTYSGRLIDNSNDSIEIEVVDTEEKFIIEISNIARAKIYIHNPESDFSQVNYELNGMAICDVPGEYALTAAEVSNTPFELVIALQAGHLLHHLVESFYDPDDWDEDDDDDDGDGNGPTPKIRENS